MFPLVGETRIRGHSLRVKGRPFRTEMRRNFFSQRVVNLWNSLAQRAVEARSLNVFKTEIDRFLRGSKVMGKRQENGVEKLISQDRMVEQTRWTEWPISAPMSYGL